MSWEEHAAALADCFQGKALALLPGPVKPCTLRGSACAPSVQPAGNSRNPPSYIPTLGAHSQAGCRLSLSWDA